MTSIIAAVLGGAYIAAVSHGLPTPLRLLIVGLPLSCLAATLSGMLFIPISSPAVFAIIVNAIFALAALVLALPHLTSHILLRLSTLPAVGLAALGARYLFKTQTSSPRRLHLFAAGCVAGAALVLWRATVPTVLFVAAYATAWHHAWHIEAAGYTLL